jgi:hypothetical protein
MNLPKPYRLVVGVLYGRIVVVRKRPAHEGIGEGSFAHRPKTEDGNLSMHERWIGDVWHCSRVADSCRLSNGSRERSTLAGRATPTVMG